MQYFKKPWTVRFILTGVLLASLSLLAAVILAIGLIGWRQISLTAANSAANSTVQLTELQIKNLVNPAATALRVLSEYPIDSKDLGEKFGFLSIMEQELKHNPLISGIYIGYANGEFISVRSLDQDEYRSNLKAPTDANYLVQVIKSENGQTNRFFDFYKYGNQLLERRKTPEFDLDPRVRPWYVAALENPSTSISEPYLFYSTGQVGVTLSRPSIFGNAIIGMDIALDDLATNLQQITITTNTALALVNNDGSVVANNQLNGQAPSNHNVESLPNITELVNSPLPIIYRDGLTGIQKFRFNNQTWLGLTTNVNKNLPTQLVMAIPVNELLGSAIKNMQLMLALTVIIILLSLSLGWWSGGKLSKYLDDLVNQARAMTRFDFTWRVDQETPIREVADLQQAANNVSRTVESFLSISKVLGTEADIDTMLQQVLEQTVDATHCVSGAVYLWNPEISKMHKSADHGSNDYYPVYIDYPYDHLRHGATNNQLQFELRDRNAQLQGELILEYKQGKQDLYGDSFDAFMNRLTGMLEVAIEARQLINQQKELFYGMIHMLADATDAKSPYTGGHCKRVPQLAIMMVDSLQKCQTGDYADFNLTDIEQKEFAIAAWLHDCGKIVIPEYIVDKASKLELIYNRIHEIRMRFEVLLRDAEIKYLNNIIDGKDDKLAKEAFEQTAQKLTDDFEFVARCNIGTEYLDDESVIRLKEIGANIWTRNFDDLIGLPEVELKQRLIGRAKNISLPATEKLLDDKPHDCIQWDKSDLLSELNKNYPTLGLDIDQPTLKQNSGELYNLSLRKGTLTEEDRYIIKNHMVHTLLMLHKLPWPEGFKDIPDIASNHHERMDGQGYPRRLIAGDLPITHRVLAIADVFEALTASDRPYKTTKTVSESLNIMANMCLENHLDTGLFKYFLENKIWLTYAHEFLQTQQLDDVDVDAILAKIS